MFTGIVTDVGEVRSVTPRAGNLSRITIACSYPRVELTEGASMACSGVCLTIVGAGEEGGRSWFAVDAAAETHAALETLLEQNVAEEHAATAAGGPRAGRQPS